MLVVYQRVKKLASIRQMALSYIHVGEVDALGIGPRLEGAEDGGRDEDKEERSNEKERENPIIYTALTVAYLRWEL